MKRWFPIAALAAALLIPASVAMAQDPNSREGDPEKDPYADYEEEERFAIGGGIGLIEPSDANITETYLMLSLRFRAGHRESDQENYRHDQGIRGYIEPELGWWKTDSADRVTLPGEGESAEDLLAGVNLIGVVPFGNVESFFGAGAGVHFIDAGLLDLDDPNDTGSKTKLGVNAQFGVDLFLTDNLSVFGTGRFDLVQDTKDSLQTKIYLGLRGRF
jgi:opacity protein-like surface antigen